MSDDDDIRRALDSFAGPVNGGPETWERIQGRATSRRRTRRLVAATSGGGLVLLLGLGGIRMLQSDQQPDLVTEGADATDGAIDGTITDEETTSTTLVVSPEPDSDDDPADQDADPGTGEDPNSADSGDDPPNPDQEPDQDQDQPADSDDQDTGPPGPPAGVVFFDDFTNPDWEARYDFGIYHRDDHLVSQTSWPGDHAPAPGRDPDACSEIEQTRTIERGQRPQFNNEWIYRCTPGDRLDDAHLITSIGDTSGYSAGAFSPNQVFTDITEVSWSVNVTDLGNRQWIEVAIVPAAAFDLADAIPCRAINCIDPGLAGYDELGAVGLAVEVVNGGSGLALVSPEHPSGDGWRKTEDGHPPCSASSRYCFELGLPDDDPALASKVERRTFVIADNGDGSLSVSFELADGSFETLTHPTSLPDGPVRVVFVDHNVTPDKDGRPVGYSWHWDDISIR